MLAFVIFVVAVGLSAGLIFGPAAGLTSSVLVTAAGYAARQAMRDS
jgi:hypothetical protein